MRVVFENCIGVRRTIGLVRNEDEAWSIISNFLKERNYVAPYLRSWEEEGEIWFDVGSHNEFFILVKGED